MAACACSHTRDAHEHYRPGTDCALCGCPRFRRPLLERLRGAAWSLMFLSGMTRDIGRRPPRR